MSLDSTCSVYIACLPNIKKNKLEKWMTMLKMINEPLVNTIKRGDLLENSSESGYRSDGLYIFDVVDGNVQICDLADSPDDYGTIPSKFELITQFPNPYYWFDDDECVRENDVISFDEYNDTLISASFHNNYVYVPFDKLMPHTSRFTEDDYHLLPADTLEIFKKNDVVKITYGSYIYFIIVNDLKYRNEICYDITNMKFLDGYVPEYYYTMTDNIFVVTST